MLTPNQKGAIAETAILAAAVRLGIVVYRPAVEGGRCDTLFEVGRQLLRVQCKWAVRKGDVVNVPGRTVAAPPPATGVGPTPPTRSTSSLPIASTSTGASAYRSP